jgi:hypothetical protein
MIIKKESVCKKTGETKVHFTTDKEGFKIVIQKGQPVEVKMDPGERSNRDHGAETVGQGAVGSSNGQKNQSRLNKEAETEYKEKKQGEVKVKISMGESNDISRKKKKVEDLSLRLKKAKLDYGSAMLDKKVADFEKKEKFYKKAEQLVKNDIKKIKDNNIFFVRGTNVNQPEKLENDIIDKIHQVVGEPQVEEVEEEKEQVTEAKLDSKLDKVNELDKLMYNGKNKSYVKGDVLSKITKKLEEAEDEEEEKDPKSEEEEETDDEKGGDDLGLDDEGEEGDDELGLDDEEEEEEPNPDALPAQENEIDRVTKANEYNVDENNVYEYYDYIIDRLTDQTAIDAMNAEYKAIPQEKRKVVAARELYDRVIKRLNMMSKAEADKLNAELSGEGAEEEGGEDNLEI